MSLEQIVIGASGLSINSVVGAHDGLGFAVDNRHAEGGKISVFQIVLGDIDVGVMAREFGSAMYGIMLGRGDRLEVLGVVALKSGHEGKAETRGEIRIFAVSFLAASPARIAEDIDVGRPDGKSAIPVGGAVGMDALDVLGAKFG